MMRHLSLLAFLTGCPGSQNSDLICDGSAAISVVVEIEDASGQPVEADRVVFGVDGGEAVDAECIGDPCVRWFAGYEQAGDFEITATRGEESETVNVTVTEGECHVNGEQVVVQFSDKLPGCELPLDGFESSLTRQMGCSDLMVAAGDDDGTLLLSLGVWGRELAREAVEAEETTITELELGVGASLTLSVGEHLWEAICNDAIFNDPVYEGTWEAISGMATITLSPEAEPGSFEAESTATVEISDAVFSDGEECSLSLGTYLWEGIGVGWLPG